MVGGSAPSPRERRAMLENGEYLLHCQDLLAELHVGNQYSSRLRAIAYILVLGSRVVGREKR